MNILDKIQGFDYRKVLGLKGGLFCLLMVYMYLWEGKDVVYRSS